MWLDEWHYRFSVWGLHCADDMISDLCVRVSHSFLHPKYLKLVCVCVYIYIYLILSITELTVKQDVLGSWWLTTSMKQFIGTTFLWMSVNPLYQIPSPPCSGYIFGGKIQLPWVKTSWLLFLGIWLLSSEASCRATACCCHLYHTLLWFWQRKNNKAEGANGLISFFFQVTCHP